MRITDWMPVTKSVWPNGLPMYTCIMPDPYELIIISTPQGLEIDRCIMNDVYGYGLEKRHTWEDVYAWMSAPEPYIPVYDVAT